MSVHHLRLGRLHIFHVRGFRMSEIGLRGLGLQVGHLLALGLRVPVLGLRVPVLGLLVLELVLPVLGFGPIELLLLHCCLVGVHCMAAKCAARTNESAGEGA